MDRHLRIISWNVQHTMTRAGARIALLEDLDQPPPPLPSRAWRRTAAALSTPWSRPRRWRGRGGAGWQVVRCGGGR